MSENVSSYEYSRNVARENKTQRNLFKQQTPLNFIGTYLDSISFTDSVLLFPKLNIWCRAVSAIFSPKFQLLIFESFEGLHCY